MSESNQNFFLLEVNFKKQKEISKILAWIQLFVFFFIVPDIIKYFWNDIKGLFPSEKYMFAIGLVSINTLTYYGGSLIFMFIYKGEFSFFEQFKIIKVTIIHFKKIFFFQFFCFLFLIFLGLNCAIHTSFIILISKSLKNKKWPWNEDLESWQKIRNKTILNSMLNLFMVGFGLLIIDLQINELKINFSLEEFPSKLENLKDFCTLLLFHDFCFYWSHRFFHQKFIYPYIHKIHHQYYQNVCIAGQYFHPLEFVITILLPTFFLVKYLGNDLHFSTLCMWIFVMGVNAVEEHSGYDFPWSPFNISDYNVSAQFHDFHHSHNIGTFGAQLNFMDKLFKTDKEFKQFMESQKQVKQTDKKIS